MKMIAGLIALALCAAFAPTLATAADAQPQGDAAIKARFAAVAAKLNALDSQWHSGGGKSETRTSVPASAIVRGDEKGGKNSRDGSRYVYAESANGRGVRGFSSGAAGGSISVGGISGGSSYGANSGGSSVREGSSSGSSINVTTTVIRLDE